MSDAIICVDQKEFRHLVQEEMRSTQIYETLLMIIHELGAQMELDSDGAPRIPWRLQPEGFYAIIKYRMPDEYQEMKQAALARLLADQEDEEEDE